MKATQDEQAAYDRRYLDALRRRDPTLSTEQAIRDVEERTRRSRVVHVYADEGARIAVPLALALGHLRIVSWPLALTVAVGASAYRAARCYIEAPLHGPLL